MKNISLASKWHNFSFQLMFQCSFYFFKLILYLCYLLSVNVLILFYFMERKCFYVFIFG